MLPKGYNHFSMTMPMGGWPPQLSLDGCLLNEKKHLKYNTDAKYQLSPKRLGYIQFSYFHLSYTKLNLYIRIINICRFKGKLV